MTTKILTPRGLGRLLGLCLVLAACAPPAAPPTGTPRPPSTTTLTATSAPSATPPPPAVQYRGDAARTGYYVGAGPRAAPSLRWQVALEGPGVHGGPVVAEGLLLVPLQDGRLVALDPATGAQRWQYTAARGIVTSPAAGQGQVFVGTEGGMAALDAATGAVAWAFGTPTRIYTAPLLVDGVLYFALENGDLYALDAATRVERWHTPLGTRALWPLAYADGRLHATSADRLLALDLAAGTVLWEAALGKEWTPLAVAAGVVYAGSGDGVFYAVDAAEGRERWRFEPAGATWWSAPAVGEGRVFVGNQNQRVYALDAQSGELLWQFAAADWAVSDPVLAGGVLYVGVGNHDRREGPRPLYALDAATGALLWEFEADSRLLAAPVVADGVVYALTTAGTVYALE